MYVCKVATRSLGTDRNLHLVQVSRLDSYMKLAIFNKSSVQRVNLHLVQVSRVSDSYMNLVIFNKSFVQRVGTLAIFQKEPNSLYLLLRQSVA